MINYLLTIIPIYFPAYTFDNISPGKEKIIGWGLIIWISSMLIGALVSALIVKANDDTFIDSMAGIVVANVVCFIILLLFTTICLVL